MELRWAVWVRTGKELLCILHDRLEDALEGLLQMVL